MRRTVGEISALPLNTGANVEQLVPLTMEKPGVVERATGALEVLLPVTGLERDLEKRVALVEWTAGDELPNVERRGRGTGDGDGDGDVEVLVPVMPLIGDVGVRDVGGIEMRKTIATVDQLDPGSIAPDAVSSVKKRKTIPPADQLDPESVSPDQVQNKNKRQEYAHTKTVIDTVIETVTGGIGIPGYPATVGSDITSVHISTITHLPSTVTAVVTAGDFSSLDTTCTETSTPTGAESTVTGILVSSALLNLPTTTKAGVDITTATSVHTGISTGSVITSHTIKSKFIPSGTEKPVRPSETAAFGTGKKHPHLSIGRPHHSGTDDVNYKTRVTSSPNVEPSASASSSMTKIIGGTSTTRIYTTVDAMASGSIKPSPVSSGKISSSVAGARPTAHVSSSPSPSVSSSMGLKAVASSLKSTSSREGVKSSSTVLAAPAMTSRIVYSGVPKVYHF
ncbi:hypothetical protein NHQ30_009297 [Ciborinia camelliae]|nr:hypothetical protein NHQ30_009297 [Ciborinia camelliae]